MARSARDSDISNWFGKGKTGIIRYGFTDIIACRDRMIVILDEIQQAVDEQTGGDRRLSDGLSADDVLSAKLCFLVFYSGKRDSCLWAGPGTVYGGHAHRKP